MLPEDFVSFLETLKRPIPSKDSEPKEDCSLLTSRGMKLLERCQMINGCILGLLLDEAKLSGEVREFVYQQYMERKVGKQIMSFCSPTFPHNSPPNKK
jgi:hypothetical protein